MKRVQKRFTGNEAKIAKTLRNMKARCSGKYERFKRYAKLSVSSEWDDAKKFIDWSLSNGWEDGLSIDRIDSSQGYSPDNCRWISHLENSLLGTHTSEKRSHNTSGFIGVWFRKDTGKYAAEIKVNKKKISLGCFTTAIEAATIRNNFIKTNNLRHALNDV